MPGGSDLQNYADRHASGTVNPIPVEVTSMTGGGDASAANQVTQITHLSEIEGAIETLESAVQARSAAVPAGQAGFMAYGIRNDALETIAEAEGEATTLQFDSLGRLWTVNGGALDPTIDGVNIGLGPGKTAVPLKYLRVTAASTGVDLWDPGAGNKIGVRWLYVKWSGALACRITIWQGANADTTFTDGTDRVLFDADLVANDEGGAFLVWAPDAPWETTVDDEELHLTTSANKIVSITCGGYEKD
jgi:hypothetical protein